MTDATPTISIGSPPLRIFAARSGDRVTGRVEFPYEANDRTEIPIDYRSQRPTQSAIRNPQSSSPIPNPQQLRVDAVKRYQQLCDELTGATGGLPASARRTKRSLADQVVSEFGSTFSVRSLQLWHRKFDLEGEHGLRDKYTPRPGAVLTLDSDQAKACVTVCAWWCFRIGNCREIDTPMMHAAFEHLVGPGHPLADLLATIDCYYSWKCDRTKYPYKPFARWAKHDLATWLLRACDDADFRAGLAAAKARKRDVLHSGNRRALRDLADPIPNRARKEAATPRLNPDPTPLEDASKLRRMGLDNVARHVVQQAAPGSLAACTSPTTIAEALGTLDDGYRRMLLDAARGDRAARTQAAAVLPLWWDAMPESLRHNIDFKIDAWRRAHPRASDRAAALRRVDMLVPDLRDHARAGLTGLGVARRLLA